jgi:single-strand DNA-binding protein
MSVNRVVLVGRLTRDPELKYTTTGVAVATMSIAVDRITKDESGNYETDFFNIVAWRRTAEFAQQYLTKGRLIAVDGRLQQRSWVDQASGQKRSVVEIVADSLQGLERKSDAAPAPDAGLAGDDLDAPVAAPAQAAVAAPAPARATAGTRGAARAAAPPPQDDDFDETDPFADE